MDRQNKIDTLLILKTVLLTKNIGVVKLNFLGHLR